MNNLTIAGILGRDAETKTTNNGKDYTKFSVAVKDGWGENEKTLWVDCTMWGDRGAKLAQYLTKGLKITASGRAGVNVWSAKDSGEAKGSLTLSIDQVTLQSGRKDDGDSGERQQKKSFKSNSNDFDLDDEIPF
jgi:single-strand DNA-binding protein